MSDTPTVKGKPVEKDGKRLVFFSEKSHFVHVAQLDGRVKRNTWGYKWAECGQGGRRSEAYYVDPEKFNDDYLGQDGEIIGEFCSICTNGLPEEGD